MGTSGIAHFHEKGIDSPAICFVHKQSDGYPDGFGDQIRDILGSANLVNGIRFDTERQVNGMGCAAAQFIAKVKDGVGGIYMLGGAKDWSDYDYHIYHDGDVPMSPNPPGHLRMKVMSGSDVLWDGKISDFNGASLYEDE